VITYCRGRLATLQSAVAATSIIADDWPWGGCHHGREGNDWDKETRCADEHFNWDLGIGELTGYDRNSWVKFIGLINKGFYTFQNQR